MKSRSAITFGALCALLGLVAVCPRFVRADISLTSDEAAARIQTTSATLRARRADTNATNRRCTIMRQDHVPNRIQIGVGVKRKAGESGRNGAQGDRSSFALGVFHRSG